MKKVNSIVLASVGLVLLIGAHGMAAWGGISLSARAGGWLPWVAGGAVAFGIYHVVQAFGFFYVIQHIRGRGRRHSHRFDTPVHDRGTVERGPHDGVLLNLGHGFVEIALVDIEAPPRFHLFFYDKNRMPRSAPRNAIVTIDTVRSDGTRQNFEFRARDKYLESTVGVPEPQEFEAIVRVSHGSHTHTHEVHFERE
jgi:hypothetical protein